MGYNYSEIVPYLLHWFEHNARILAWRENPKPYYVWVSEIMLQQTRVEAVKGYFDRFIAALPDVPALAGAEEAQLLKLWEGLGYYNRVRNMQKAAKLVVERYGGGLPADFEALKALPGIGPYTAGAIASIAFGIAEPCVDGNVLRVLKRIAASYDDITKEKVKKELEDDIRRILPAERPGDFNQALMELGAMVCLPNGKPLCEQCPVMHLCKAFHAGVEMQLPVKPEKKARRVEERTLFLIKQENGETHTYEIALHRRARKGLLAGMWELPAAEGFLEEDKVRELFLGWDRGEIPGFRLRRLPDSKHIFSHIEWHMRCYEVCLETGVFLGGAFENIGLPEEQPDGNKTSFPGCASGGIQAAGGCLAELSFFTGKQIAEEISLPSAFDAYRECMGEFGE